MRSTQSVALSEQPAHSKALRREIRGNPVAWAFLGLALTFGLILVFLVPPFQTNDGPDHYFRSWAIAEDQVFVGPGALVELPTNVAWLFSDLHAIEVTQGKDQYDLGLTLSHLTDRVSSQRTKQTTLTGTYSPVGYLPQVLGIDLVRVFGGSPLLALYVAQMLVLVTSVALVFLALRLTPFGAPVLALLALLPMSMALSASLNPNAVLNASSILWMALVLRAAATPRLRPGMLVLLSVTAVFLLTAKPGYFALAFLILLVPHDRYPSRRLYWATAVVCIAGAIAMTAALVATAPTVRPDVLTARGNPAGIDSAAQFRFVLEHPWAFTKVVIDTVGSGALAWMKELVGAPGRASVILSDLVTYVALLGGLLLMMRSATVGVGVAAWQRAGLLAVGASTALSVIGALYVLGSPVASAGVMGIQGRYFLPIAPCLFIGLYGLRLRGRRMLIAVLATCVVLMATMTILALLGHYYGT